MDISASKVVIGQLNLNGMESGKLEPLKGLICNYIDILIIIEWKIDSSFTSQQLFIDGFSMPYRLNRNIHDGGILAFVRDDIPSAQLSFHTQANDFDGLFFEINFWKKRCLVF